MQDNKIQWVYSAPNNYELSDRYNQWAKDYERDLNETFGRLKREPIADLTFKYVPRNGRILYQIRLLWGTYQNPQIFSRQRL
ncbi:MAG: hypothetical protein F6K14_04390 [Symploca sp. SIO2C1]|nr:hypothetical protein [Symploca sp. SIO2C1]